MKPLRKSQDCTDHDPIESWRPKAQETVDYWLALHIGPADGVGTELFYVNVLSRSAASLLPSDDLLRRKALIVEEYSWTAVMAAVSEILQQVEGPDWHSIAMALSARFYWEFENYQPSGAPNH